MKFLKKIFGFDEDRPTVGDARFTWWQNPDTKEFGFHLQAPNNEIIAPSEGYGSKAGMMNAIAAIRLYAGSAKVVRREVA